MIEEIDIGEIRKQNAKIAICQISLSSEVVSLPGKKCSSDKLSAIWSRIERTLAEVMEENPDVIQFPECSVPFPLIKKLQAFSKKNDVIIIGGTHYFKEKDGWVSRCPVIFPDETFFTEKICPSPLERSPIRGSNVISGQIRYFFRNTRVGNFFVYICADFLETSTLSEIETYDPTLVFVSAFHSTSEKQYFPKLNDACGVGLNGCYCAYSNMKSSTGNTVVSDGNSSLFGLSDKTYYSAYQEGGFSDMKPLTKVWQAKSNNDYVVAEIDLETRKPETPKRINTSPNIKILTDRSRLRAKAKVECGDRDFKLAVFDMDGTLLRGILFSWVKLWELCGDDGTLWKKYLNDYRSDKLAYTDWCNLAVKHYRETRLTKDLIFEIAQQEVRIVQNLATGMNELRKLGFKTALVSGGVDIFMYALMPNYKSLFDDVHINRLTFDGEDIVHGVNVTPYDYIGKATAIEVLCEKYGIDIEESIFVGDAYNDEYALKKAGYSLIFGQSEDGVRHVSNHSIESEDFQDVVDHIKSLIICD